MSNREKYVLIFRYRYREQIFRMVSEHATYDDALKRIKKSKNELAEGAMFFSAKIVKHTSEEVHYEE